MSQSFAALQTVPTVPNREALWDHAREAHGSEPVLYVEFGVFQGYSLRHWMSKERSPASRFIGLDTFTGLPEDWGSVKKGVFDVGPDAPRFDDPRVTLVKGLFQDTWDALARMLAADLPGRRLVVHFDADLYSSTLFVLARLDALGVPYLAIFDEFYGDEPRALHDYLAAFQASATFLAAITERTVVLARITPKERRG